MRIHDLRHGIGTLATNAGTHPRIVAELMGHTRIATTMDTYAQAMPDTMREAVRRLDDTLRGAG
jgi:integrase